MYCEKRLIRMDVALNPSVITHIHDTTTSSVVLIHMTLYDSRRNHKNAFGNNYPTLWTVLGPGVATTLQRQLVMVAANER